MNLSNIKNAIFDGAADDQAISDLELQVGYRLPESYVALLKLANGFSLGNGLVIYSSSDVLERNVTFEFDIYLNSFLAIGDDSGGRSFLISLKFDGVFMVYQGDPDPDEVICISSSIISWVADGCKYDHYMKRC